MGRLILVPLEPPSSNTSTLSRVSVNKPLVLVIDCEDGFCVTLMPAPDTDLTHFSSYRISVIISYRNPKPCSVFL